jgi:hypothetical protein
MVSNIVLLSKIVPQNMCFNICLFWKQKHIFRIRLDLPIIKIA